MPDYKPRYSNIIFLIMIVILIVGTIVYIFTKDEGFRRGHWRRPGRRPRRFPIRGGFRGNYWNTYPYPLYNSYPFMEAPYCDDVLCGNAFIGWDCCKDMKCKKGQHKCCSAEGRCRCCMN